MKNLFLLLTLMTVGAALSSCGKVIGAVIPAQSIGDPIGLNGKTLTTSTPLQPAAVQGHLSYSTNGARFQDLVFDRSKIPLGIMPHAVEFRTRFSTVTLGGVCQAQLSHPTATVTLSTLRVTVSDAARTATFSASPAATLTLTWNAAQGTYVASSDVVSIKADASTTDAFTTVLTTGEANEASITALIRVDQDSLAGCTLAFTVKDPEVILSKFS
ncbi:hypothetical protein LAJ19_00500 [Deinococcus taeanensis]|uniref:hypothetical protein n=1 Tax=Deinococcus taeanensis TaxID=2737050 RepID=UPI001CDC7295|nr:hypothetical protein [Deinococcus taeanensis]UBV42753.1 hypothetical protein LAJ19_00500 [Deinococcus taeanensis]